MTKELSLQPLVIGIWTLVISIPPCSPCLCGLSISAFLTARADVPAAERCVLQSGMALLIDGYNLLNVTGIFAQAGPGTELHRTRLALLNFLSAVIDKRERSSTTIVFDAAGAPPG